jgi:hypothetical protein
LIPTAFIGMADIMTVDLDGIDRLDKNRLLSCNVDHIAYIDLPIGQLDDADIYSGIVVNDATNKRFSYPDSHNQPPLLY